MRSSSRPASALYVSSDGGKTWEARDKSQRMVWRPFYFARMIVDPTNPDRVFKDDGNLILSEDGGKSFSVVGGFAGHARRHARRVDQPEEPEARCRRRRRRPLVQLRRRQPLVEGRKPADLAVLPRERRRPGPVPGLWRPAGQLELGRRQRLPGRHHQQPLGKPVRRRRLLDVQRPGRPRLRLRRVPGRQPRARQPPYAPGARHPADGRAAARSCASTGTRRCTCRRTRRARSTSAPSSCSAPATTARAGIASRRTSRPTIRRSSSRKNRAA